MRTRRTRRIGLTEADRLVAGNPPGPDHRGLVVLLDAAKAPPSIEELAGETAAVARLVAAFRTAAAQPSANNRVQVRRPARMVAVKMAAGVAVLAAGGTAVAAETGSFPAGVQRFFSPVDAPTLDGGPTFTPTGADPGPGPGNGSAVPSPSPTPAPSRSEATSRPAEATKLILCRAWDAERTDPRGKPMPVASRHALAAEAGGEHGISDFCVGVLSVSASPSTSQPTGSASTGTGSNGANPGDNGNGGGNGDGGGNGQGAGNGNGGANGKGRTPVSPGSTPTPRNSPQA